MGRVGRFAGLMILAGLLLGLWARRRLHRRRHRRRRRREPGRRLDGEIRVSESTFEREGRRVPIRRRPKRTGEETAPSDKKDAAKDDVKKSAKKLTRAEKKEAAIAEARAAVKEMIRKLGKGDIRSSCISIFPIDEYVRGFAAASRSNPVECDPAVGSNGDDTGTAAGW